MNAAELYDQVRPLLTPVPSDRWPNVCHLCFGPQDPGYDQCAGCWKLFGRKHESLVPDSLRGRVVPMSIAINGEGGVWYGILNRYKRAEFREWAHILAAFAYEWLKTNIREVYGLVGGRPDTYTIVPSKRGYSYDQQPLRRALAMTFKTRLSETLRCVKPAAYRRAGYELDVFEPTDANAIRGKKIVLIEDTWITGATALTAAGTLLEWGAESVAIFPIAREVKPSFHTANTVYLSYLDREYHIRWWPRSDVETYPS